jgi:hypothetical protein
MMPNSPGVEQQEAFDLIRKYLSSAPVLKAPHVGVSFRLYIAAEDKFIGVVLTQETEKLCLNLFYACTKCRCYLLSSHCTVSGQTDVIKYMLQNPIMSGRIGKWAYALIEYDLAYEPLKSMKGQVVADFIVEHRIDDTHKLDISYLTVTPGFYILMDRFVMKDKELASCLFHQVISLSTSPTD